eukprot:gene6726-6946_t
MAEELLASSALDTADTAAAAAGNQQLNAIASPGEQQRDCKDVPGQRAAGQVVQQHDILVGTSSAATATADISATDTGTSSHHAVDVAAADECIAAPCLDGKLHVGVAAEQPGPPAPDGACSPSHVLQAPGRLQTWQGCEISKAATPGHAAPAMLQLDAARWLLLSKRALQSGPPGCDKPIAVLPGHVETVAGDAAEAMAMTET